MASPKVLLVLLIGLTCQGFTTAFSFDDFLDDALDSLSDAIDEGVDDVLGDLGLDNETIDDVKDAVDDTLGSFNEMLPDSADDVEDAISNDVTEKVSDVMNALTGGDFSLEQIVDILTDALGNESMDDIDSVLNDIISQLPDFLRETVDIDAILESTTLADARDGINSFLALIGDDESVEIPALPDPLANNLSNLTINEVLTVVDDILGSLFFPNDDSSFPTLGLLNSSSSESLQLLARIVFRAQQINEAVTNFTLARVAEGLQNRGFNLSSGPGEKRFQSLVSPLITLIRNRLEEFQRDVFSELQNVFENIFTFPQRRKTTESNDLNTATTIPTTRDITAHNTKRKTTSARPHVSTPRVTATTETRPRPKTTLPWVTTTSNPTTTFPSPESGRFLASLVSRLQGLGGALQNMTQNRFQTFLERRTANTATDEGAKMNGVIPNIIGTVRSLLQSTIKSFESLLQQMLTTFISALRSNDGVFLDNVFRNKTDEEIADMLTKNLQDLIPLLMKVASGQATFNDVKCVLADNVLRMQLKETFEQDQTREIVSSLLLTLVGCDAQLNAGGSVLTNASQTQTGVQAMTALTSFTEEIDVDPVGSIRDTLSNLSSPLSDPDVFRDRLSTFLLILGNIISQTTTTAAPTTTQSPAVSLNALERLLRQQSSDLDVESILAISRSVLNSISDPSKSNVEQLVSSVLQVVLAQTSIGDPLTQIISNRVSTILTPVVLDFVNSSLSNSPIQLQALGSLLSQIDLENPLSLVNALSDFLEDGDGSLGGLLPPYISQLLNMTTSRLGSLDSLMAVPEAVMAIGQIYSSGYNTSRRCQLERSAVGTALMSLEAWSLLFVDAMGKLGTGVLQGNTYLVGNFDQCEAISGQTAQGDVIQANYVKYKFRIPLPNGIPSMNGQAESGLPIVIWGLCLPKGCSQQDAIVIGDGVAAGLNVAPVSAEIITTRDPSSDSVFVVAMFIFGTLGLMCVIGTFLDVLMNNQSNQEKNKPPSRRGSKGRSSYANISEDLMNRSPTGERVLNPASFRDLRVQLATMESREGDQLRENSKASNKTSGLLRKCFLAFSVYTNARDIWSARQSPSDVACLHGIRVLSITWVILGHVYFFFPQFGNITTLVDMTKLWTFQGILNALVAVDTFFVLSGCLVAYLFLRSVKKAGGLKAKHMVLYYTHRYLRLTPLYALAILFYTGVTPYMENGPFQREVTDRDVYCRDKWYWNLLYISNLRNDAEICIQWSWYLPNDMQFYLIAPLMLVPWALGYKIVGLLIAFLQFACHVIVFALLEEKYDATATRNATDYFVYIYIKPYTRCAPYAVGLVLGFILYKTKCKVSLHKFVVFLGWVLAFGGALTTLYITADNYDSEYGIATPNWSQEAMNAYEVVCKPIWALCVAWLIFACATGYGGIINTILSWKAWIPLSRLTYGVYLLHVMIIIYFNNNRRTLAYVSKEYVIVTYLAVTVLSYGLSFVMSLLIETPVRNLTKPKPMTKPSSPSTRLQRTPSSHLTGSFRQPKVVSFSGDVNFINNDYNSLPHTPRHTHPSAPEADEMPVSLPSTPAVQETSASSIRQRIGSPNSLETESPPVGPATEEPELSRHQPNVYPNLAYVIDEGDWVAAALGYQPGQETANQNEPSTSTSAQEEITHI